jgi:probable F420-dependent oxidoreductase
MKIYLHSTFLDPENLIATGVAAEEAGFYGMTVSDHVIYPRLLESGYPIPDSMWAPTDPWPEPWVTIGAVAGATTTLRFATAIYISPLRPVLEVAKLISTAAVLSDYRAALGVGVGWMKEEYDLMGQDFATRGKRLDEQLEILRLVWKGGYQEYHGTYHDIPAVSMVPAPKKPIPVYVGGDAPVSLRRAARQDGWIGMHYTFDRARELLRQLDEHRRRTGSDARKDYEVMFMQTNVPDAEAVKRLEELGATSIFVAPWEADEHAAFQKDPGRDAILRSIDRYGRDVVGVVS